MACGFQLNILQTPPCLGRGLCSGNDTCICDPGVSSESDWFKLPVQTCITDSRALWTTAIVLTTLSVFAIILILFKFALLHGVSKRSVTNLREPRLITLLMSVPVVIIVIYEVIFILSDGKAFLLDSVSLIICLILLNLTWQISAFCINRHLIRIVSSAQPTKHPIITSKSNRVILLCGLINIVTFFILAIILIILYTSKNPGMYRAYCIATSFYVLIHAVPYFYSSVLESELRRIILQQKDASPANISPRTALEIAHNNISGVKQSFLGTSVFFYNILFAIFTEWSPYYVQVQFAVGIVFSLGCYRLFPASEIQEEPPAPVSAISDFEHGTHGPQSSALSDTLGGVASHGASHMEDS